ncbi:MAG: carbon-nitrogen hydrolase family protein [Candidatus Latescibacteria bacterium]|nr:carbon-nitrogen hydrolase family protein [Candidatus Latescibacterota bacterium]
MGKAARAVTIGMLKAMPAKWDVEGNWAIFEEQLKRHKGDGIDVFVTPECFLDGYAVTESDWTLRKFARVAQSMDDSPYIRKVRQMARRYDMTIVFGFTELLDGHFRNAAALIGRDGDLVGKYHKTHLLNHDLRFARGGDLPVFDLDIGRVGMVICADRRWPESVRTLRLKGAEICLMPTYGMRHLENEWWMRTRSYENQMFVCFTHPAVALITNPKGGIEAKLDSNVHDVLVHEIDLAEVNDDNHLANRRPELYDVLTDSSHSSVQQAYDAPRTRAKGAGRSRGR